MTDALWHRLHTSALAASPMSRQRPATPRATGQGLVSLRFLVGRGEVALLPGVQNSQAAARSFRSESILVI